MKFKLKERTPTATTKITRIEIRNGGKSKILTLDHVNAVDLFEFIRSKLAKITEHISVELPIIESPIKHIKQCRVQVYEATTSTVARKENFKSFTCYGMDEEGVTDLIKKIIKVG